VHEGVVIGAGAQYAVAPWVSVGFVYLYGIYGTQEHGSVSNVLMVFRKISPPTRRVLQSTQIGLSGEAVLR
jgi:opacity protein-like surface antigen